MTKPYPNGAFVSTTVKGPYYGRIVVQDEGSGPSRELWRCDHEHASAAEAFACAGEEIGRDGKT